MVRVLTPTIPPLPHSNGAVNLAVLPTYISLLASTEVRPIRIVAIHPAAPASQTALSEGPLPQTAIL